MRRHIAIAVLAGALVAALATPALAGKGGGHGGSGGGGGSTSAWVSASPNPAAAWGTTVVLSGCGYQFEPAEVYVVHSAGYTEIYWATMWSSGGNCLSGAFTTAEPGTYTIDVYQDVSPSHPKRGTALVASTTLTVQ
jgi:hypothetical protein